MEQKQETSEESGNLFKVIAKKGTMQRRECRIRKNVYNGNLEMNENFVNEYSNAFLLLPLSFLIVVRWIISRQ